GGAEAAQQLYGCVRAPEEDLVEDEEHGREVEIRHPSPQPLQPGDVLDEELHSVLQAGRLRPLDALRDRVGGEVDAVGPYLRVALAERPQERALSAAQVQHLPEVVPLDHLGHEGKEDPLLHLAAAASHEVAAAREVPAEL